MPAEYGNNSSGNFIHKRGWIEVVVGGMFSGKTEELIRRLRRAQFARQKVQVFKPIIDDRYSAEDVTSHNQNSIKTQSKLCRSKTLRSFGII